MSRGLRNCNPGNIRISTTKWIGEIQPSTDKSFKQFKAMPYGYRALIKLLQNYRKLHNRLLRSLSKDGLLKAKTTHRVIYHVFAKKCKFRLPISRTLKTKRLCVLLRLQLVRSRMQRPL